MLPHNERFGIEATNPNTSGIQFQFEDNFGFGIPVEVAEGIWWIKLPIESSLEYVNAYCLRDGNGLTLVDTGVNNEDSKTALESALASPALSSLPLRRIIVTHFHPDHIGLAGYLARKLEVPVWMSRTCWLSCKLLIETSSDAPKTIEVEFMKQAGLTGIDLEAYKRQPANRFNNLVSELPDQFMPLIDDQVVVIGTRTWRVVVGHGHAAEHLTLWSESLAIVGDQILPSVSANLTVPFTEPDIDLIAEWKSSCEKLSKFADNDQLCLPGHQRPYTGIRNRLVQIQCNIDSALTRLTKLLTRPSSALDCLDQFHNRPLTPEQRRLLLPELVGFLNHLRNRGEADRKTNAQGVAIYHRINQPQHIASMAANGLKQSVLQLSQQQSKTKSAQPVALEQSPSSVEPNKDTNMSQPSQLESKKDNTPIAEESVSTKTETKPTDKPGFIKPQRIVAALLLATLAGICWTSWEKLKSIAEMTIKQVQQFNQPEFRVKRAGELAETITPVSVMRATQLPSTELPRRFTGILKPQKASEVGFNRIGTMDEILVERGQKIQKDQVIAKLNVASLQANLKAVHAQYKAATARLEEMIAGPRSQTIDAARNQVEAAKAEVELARTVLGRAERLVGIGAVSKQEVDTATTTVKGKQEALKAAQNGLDELIAGTRDEQLRAQRAVLTELEAAQEQMKVQLDESVLRAPFAATVSERYLDPGSVCSPGVPVVRLVAVGAPEAWIGLPPEYLNYISIGQQFKLNVGKQQFSAKVKSILPEMDAGTRTNTVVFELLEGDNSSLFGQVAEIELSKPIQETGFWLPMSAIVKGDQGLWAALALEETDSEQPSKLLKRELEVIHVEAERAYVRGTIKDGDRVVASGLHRLTAGQLVQEAGQQVGPQVGSSDTTTLR
ncbi:MAG: efflux RND transporter periplasmic adaptor subunit [Pirellulales bacterium]